MSEQEPIEKKPKKKIYLILGSIANFMLFLVLGIIFALTEKVDFWKPLLKWIAIIGGIQLIIYIIYFLVKSSKKKEKQEIPFIFQKSGEDLNKAKEAAEHYVWDNFGIKPNRCLNYRSGPMVVELKTGQPIEVFTWYFKELITLKRKEYVVIALGDKVFHTMVKKTLTDEEILSYAKEIATQRLEIEHKVFRRTDPVTGNIIEEESHTPIFPQIETKKEVGKL